MFILRATEWRESLTGSDGRRKEKGQDPVWLALDMKMDSSSEVTEEAENLCTNAGRLGGGGWGCASVLELHTVSVE